MTNKIDFTKATFKDFENIPNLDLRQRAELFSSFLNFMKKNEHLNYRFISLSGCSPEMEILRPGDEVSSNYISLVSNDYLGFTQHPKVKSAAIEAIEKYGTGAGASPLIGGHFHYHELLEQKIANFFGRDKESAVTFTTGYTANSATLLALMQKEDIAIVDMAVHASVHEGCLMTNKKSFLHNDIENLELILKKSQDRYRTKMVIVDGVYSQDGDMAPLKEILELTKKYQAYLMVDDAHGIGVIGKSGRGALETAGILKEVDFITGTFSKTFANIGGYVIANSKHISFLKFQSRQQIFSATSNPSSMGIIKAIELIDEEPQWRQKLIDNMIYFKKGLKDLGLNIGTTESAIIPVKIGDPHKTGDAGKMLLKYGIYANPILYPAVAKKNARIRMSLSATHTKEQLDRVLNVFDYVNKKLHISD